MASTTLLSRTVTLRSLALALLVSTGVVRAVTSYANDFADPDYIVSGNFGKNTQAAQNTIVEWAKDSAVGGPWSVTSKPYTPPSGDKHDYMSWSPYWWPDCSEAGNKTELTPEQIWTTCPYKQRDGLFNPDVREINDIGHFESLADAVLYNTLAWSISQDRTYADTAAKFIKTWFLDDATRMNPNLNYGQVKRGPGNSNGTHTGLLDLKCMTKVVNGILILRKTNSSAWPGDMDSGMNTWVQQYIAWLETATIANEEQSAANNHGTFFYNQLASLKILLGDFAGARNVTDMYFNGIYMNQIVEGGEQPLEAIRTRPYHYRAYNLAAMITNARLAQYADRNAPSMWNKTTEEGSTIKDALDYAMTISPSASHEDNYAQELYLNVAAVASVYGDPDGKYATFLDQKEPQFVQEPFYLWNQPFAMKEGLAAAPNNTKPNNNASNPKNNNSAMSGRSVNDIGLYTVILSYLVYLLT
ncbi:hypothetical protein AGABI2DRAFT_226405 [Agaricus bisporus var. bisporus H97]|uniref:hypothetical protein n=1 Tax=Agaricus bisporus var. bisporus (strain H97 / ATCC MYA-4626 / FGSC 10389) TaxID=936046 RepID=UPI00029F6B63|nr:hypothetical protein AGABI2DRAFT_226405 [Agaricus bisporus var. bisporus H97]EKV43839.1 hypothetical protein AGABI2DRAFT_226405 [Agaricus bisporus var. bisporus H97]